MLLKKNGLTLAGAAAVLGLALSLPAQAHVHHDEGHQQHKQMKGEAMPVAKGIKVHMGWSRALPPVVKNGAAYLMIHNYSGERNAIVGAYSDVAGSVEMHTSESGSDGMMTMSQLDKVAIQPGGAVTFKPGGHHFMLIDLKKPLKAGEQFPLYLKMARGGDVKVMIDIKGADKQQAHNHHHHH